MIITYYGEVDWENPQTKNMWDVNFFGQDNWFKTTNLLMVSDFFLVFLVCVQAHNSFNGG